MMRMFLVAAIALAMPALAAAQTEAQYSSEKVLEHFTQACPGENCLAKPQTRAVCIGTAAECAPAEAEAAEAATAEVGAFDLLITFRFGSDQLSDQARANLTEFARALNDPALSEATFNIDGHTDAVGSDAFNQTLSERRAASVVEFLESLGVSPERLRAQGHGESLLRDPENPKAGINRRVEASLRR